MGRTIIFLAALAIIVQTQGQVTDIVRGEYWIQQDDGVDGINIPFAIGGANDVVDFQLPIDLTGYAPGTYDVGIRVLDGTGHWSLTSHAAVLVIAPEVAGVIDQIETFFLPGPDPYFGMAEQHAVVSPSAELQDYQFEVPALLADWGDTLMIRSRDSHRRWSLTNHVIVYGSTNANELANKTNISVYPNPFAEQIKVQPTDDQPVRVILYDPQGKLVVDRIIRSETMLDLSKEASGMYTAFFWKDLKVIHRVTLVKQ
ncbi:MAG: T9SS type A sorting domain-containing protein [Flavobacteriales bacterium]|jgi:hypothetical protein|nr:T9SS type A sorting domain-containing protein [Flavobacteriales bacterium]